MKWVDSSRADKRIAPYMSQMLFAGADRADSSPEVRRRAGRAAFEQQDYAKAAAYLSAALDDDGGEKNDWYKLAQSLLHLKRYGEVLNAVRLGLEAYVATGALLATHAKALQALGREGEAFEAFLSAADHGTVDDACFEILRTVARRHDGDVLLAAVDMLTGRYGDRTIIKANRAIAYSMLGRNEDAFAFVDLERQIVRRDMREVMDEGDLADFHASLISEAKQAAPLHAGNDIRVEYRPSLDGMPAMRRLFDWAKGAFEDCLVKYAAQREHEWLERQPETATLFHAVTMIRNDESNGQHIHRPSLISGVYHLLVPDDVTAATDDRGALEVGNVDGYTQGHEACWGKRLLKPVAGQFTMFPAHIFHDVIPTQSQALRISIPMDLQVVQPGE